MSVSTGKVRALLSVAVECTIRSLGAIRPARRTPCLMELLEARINFGQVNQFSYQPPPLVDAPCPPPPPVHSTPGGANGAGGSDSSGSSGESPNDLIKYKAPPGAPLPTTPPGGSVWDTRHIGVALSSNPVRSSDGLPDTSATDLQSDAFGSTFGIMRSWTGNDNAEPVGNGWTIMNLPRVAVTGGLYLDYPPGGGGGWSPGNAPQGSYPDERLQVIDGGMASMTFTITPDGPYDSYSPWGGQDAGLTMTRNATAGTLSMTDPAGNVTTFYDVDRDSGGKPIPNDDPTQLYGKFKSYTSASGTVTQTATYNSGGNITQLSRSDSATSQSEELDFTYSTVTNDLVTAASGTAPQLATNIAWKQGGTIVRQAVYDYYTGRLSNGMGGYTNDPNGRLGDLRTVTIDDGSGNAISGSYYRYYKFTGESDLTSSPGPTNVEATTGGPDPLQPAISGAGPTDPDAFVYSGLKTVVTDAAFSRLAGAVSGYQTASDATIQPYINNFFTFERWGDHEGADGVNWYGAAEYNQADSLPYRLAYRPGSSYRVTEEIAQGAGCSSCSGGQGTSKFEYATDYFYDSGSGGYPGMGFETQDYNIWRYKTTEYLSDDTTSTWADNDRQITYTNEVGQPMLSNFVHVDGGSAFTITGISDIAQVSGGVTIQVTAPSHGLSVGDTVALGGILPQYFNGVFKVTAVDDANTFEFLLPTSDYDSQNNTSPTPYVNTTLTNSDSSTVTIGNGFGSKVVSQTLTYYRYDDAGRLIETASPSAMLGYNEGSLDLVDTPTTPMGLIAPNSGDVQKYTYAGWEFDGQAGIAANGATVNSYSVPSASGGTQAAYIWGHGIASQTISGWAAGTYTIDFHAAADTTGFVDPLSVYVDGTRLTFNSGADTSVTAGSSYASYASDSFTVPAGIHQIRFVGSGDTTMGTAMVDQVSIVGTGAPTVTDSSFETDSVGSGNFVVDPSGYAITATSTTGGTVQGMGEQAFVQEGQNGTPILLTSYSYYAHTAGGQTIFPEASITTYGNTDGTDARVTNYSYTYYSGTNALQSETVTTPPITSTQNGPASSTSDTSNADTGTQYFDPEGRLVWARDGGGFLTYTAYDDLSGGVAKFISDVNTSDTGDFSGLPSGWTTPSGGGQELIITRQVDKLGRTTKLTDPNGNVTYTLYNDAGHETRVYPGWHLVGSTYQTTGPIEVMREYRPASGSGSSTVYDETLTSSATPSIGSGVPTGAETINSSNIQSLSRSITNSAGQMVEEDDYFSLSGVTYSPSSVHLGSSSNDSSTGAYHATQYHYNARGWQDKVTDPAGTITRTVFDGLHRVVSQWVGTNDTPSSGYWSPTNNTSPSNMVDVADYTYDNGSVGDSNLTRVVQHPGGGAADRVTLNLYDWRDRLIATKQGALLSSGSPNPSGETDSINRLITYTSYDNLGEPTASRTYAGDGVSLSDFSAWTTSTDSSKLRAYSTQSYDDQGRVYLSAVYSVDPTSGSVGYDLVANTFYDHRGNVVETSSPGGIVTKHAFDGAGRDVKDSTTDGGVLNSASANWTNAQTTTNDVVIEQTLSTYDPAGNPTETISKQRFDNDATTSTGDLGGPSSGVNARVYYSANYYDAANRATDSVNVGTNGGPSWTRPSSVPSRSDTVLVNHTDYDPAGRVLDTIDPRGIEAARYYDLLGRTTKTIAAWDGTSSSPTPGNSTNQITTYTYNGNGSVLSQTAVMSGTTPSQTTAYVYGVTSPYYSNLFSNDLLRLIKYPDPTTGAASTSASYQQGWAYNALGQKVYYTDQNATTHQYSYDVLGRMTADNIPFGVPSGVSNQTQGIGYSYNDAGLPFKQTSYSDTSLSTPFAQNDDIYNGYGQLVQQYQEYSGTVNTSTSASVQYGYSQPSGANYSRLSSMTYPNGRILDYGYNMGLDTTCPSREVH